MGGVEVGIVSMSSCGSFRCKSASNLSSPSLTCSGPDFASTGLFMNSLDSRRAVLSRCEGLPTTGWATPVGLVYSLGGPAAVCP